MPENIRLVIWDLDETFWQGTITEGGYQYSRFNHNVVIELAKRGIISTICSKNDLEPVRDILHREGLWSYFVFPSISWDPKGPRIAKLIEAMMLRPETVLLIDDNPSNLNEARHFTPTLRVSTPDILATILENPLFVGKEDRALHRLAHYRLLEQRHADQQLAISVGSGNHEFLRSSNIRVIVNFDVRRHIDRAVELVNRTNQLNFTKLRLPEDPEAARAELLALIDKYDMQAGLVQVIDNYGDYGFVGFYAVKTRNGRNDLVHYCFSCRTLGMGIETWVYRRLAKPWLPIVGEVLGDPRDDALPVDWITQMDLEADASAGMIWEKTEDFGRILLRGGCEMASLSHYFVVNSNCIVCEPVIARNGVPIRSDHSLFLTNVLDGITPEVENEIEALGYRSEDFNTSLFDPDLSGGAIVLSFWSDSEVSVYRHRKLGFRIPFVAPYHFPIRPDENVMSLPKDLHFEGFDSEHWIFKAIQHLRDHYEFEGVLAGDLFKSNLQKIFTAFPAGVRVFLLSANETWLNPGNNLVYEYSHHTSLNQWMTEVADLYPQVRILDTRTFIMSEEEAQSVNHFSRMVYFRMYQGVAAALGQPHAGEAARSVITTSVSG